MVVVVHLDARLVVRVAGLALACRALRWTAELSIDAKTQLPLPRVTRARVPSKVYWMSRHSVSLFGVVAHWHTEPTPAAKPPADGSPVLYSHPQHVTIYASSEISCGKKNPNYVATFIDDASSACISRHIAPFVGHFRAWCDNTRYVHACSYSRDLYYLRP